MRARFYSFAPVCALLRTGSIRVAFITSPLIFSFPLMNSFCAFAFPAIKLAKSVSERERVTFDNGNIKSVSEANIYIFKNKKEKHLCNPKILFLFFSSYFFSCARLLFNSRQNNSLFTNLLPFFKCKSPRYPPSALPPSGAVPLPTSPFFFRSIYQLSVSSASFLSVKQKTALIFLMASARSAGDEFKEDEIASKAAEEGNDSVFVFCFAF